MMLSILKHHCYLHLFEKTILSLLIVTILRWNFYWSLCLWSGESYSKSKSDSHDFASPYKCHFMKFFDLLHKKWRFIALFHLSMIAKTEKELSWYSDFITKKYLYSGKINFLWYKVGVRENDTPWKKSHCYIKNG